MGKIMMKQEAIGVFDSGVGGLTVVKALAHELPHEHLIYFGDTARVPYGTKSAETIIRYSVENSIFLLNHKVKCIVIACNTASAYALEHLQHLFKVPVIGVITPGVEAALAVSKNRKIGVIGTSATIHSNVYKQEIQKRDPHTTVISLACPLFVPLVEEGYLGHAATQLLTREYLEPIKESGIDTLILGCTHYPLLKEQIQEVLGSKIHIVDSAQACAKAVAKVLSEKELHGNQQQPGISKFFVSDDPSKFEAMAIKFLGSPLSHIEKIG